MLRLLLVLSAVFMSSTVAYAEERSISQRRQAAKKLGDRAYAELKAKRYGQAVALFRQADDVFHSPLFLVFWADAEVGRKRFVEAKALLQRVIAEELADYAPESFREAQRMAEQRRRELQPRIPTLQLEVSGEAVDGMTLGIDGKPLASSMRRQSIEVNPGGHEIAVTTEDGRTLRRKVQVVEGQSYKVALAMGPARLLETTDEDVSEASSSGPPARTIGAGIAFGLGGIGLATGLATTVLFFQESDVFNTQCLNENNAPNFVPPIGCEARKSEVEAIGDVSTASWIVGAAGIVGGVLVLTLVPDDSAAEQQARWPQLTVGPSGASLRGHF